LPAFSFQFPSIQRPYPAAWQGANALIPNPSPGTIAGSIQKAVAG